MRRRLLFMALSCAAILPAFAIDPGTVQGTLQVNDKAIELRQAYAHLHDNAEGLLDRPKELRILLPTARSHRNRSSASPSCRSRTWRARVGCKGCC